MEDDIRWSCTACLKSWRKERDQPAQGSWFDEFKKGGICWIEVSNQPGFWEINQERGVGSVEGLREQ